VEHGNLPGWDKLTAEHMITVVRLKDIEQERKDVRLIADAGMSAREYKKVLLKRSKDNSAPRTTESRICQLRKSVTKLTEDILHEADNGETDVVVRELAEMKTDIETLIERISSSTQEEEQSGTEPLVA